MNEVRYAMWVVYAYTIWIVATYVWDWWERGRQHEFQPAAERQPPEQQVEQARELAKTIRRRRQSCR